jgi:hypothetical protein
MRYPSAILILTVASALSAPSFAAEPAAQPLSTKRQMVDCMTKRMSASRTLSYNAAMQACKDALQDQKTAVASNTQIESAAVKTR